MSDIQKKVKKIVRKLSAKFYRVIKQIKKEFRLALFSDPWNLIIALLLPPGIIMLLSVMEGSQITITEIPVTVVSYDSTKFIDSDNVTGTYFGTPTEFNWDNYSQPYIDAVNKSEFLLFKHFYNVSEDPYAMETAREQLLNSEIGAIIVVPVDFSEFLEFGLPGTIECVPDSSRIDDIQNKLNAVYDSVKVFVNDNNLTPQIEVTGFEEFAIPSNYNPSFNSTIKLLIPLMGYGIANVLGMLIIVKEKPIARLLLTPVKRSEILFSKYATYSLILFVQDLGVILSSLFGGLYIRGSLLDVFIASYMVGYTGLSMGIFISSVSKTKTEANQWFLASFVVILLLSGIGVPIESMPPYLQVVAYILPLSHGQPMLTAILSKGASVFGFHFFSLLAISVVLNVATLILFYIRRYEV